MRNEIEALLRAVESADHIDVCASYEDLSCDCDLRDIHIAAAAVRAELAPKPVPDGELLPCPFCGGEAAVMRMDGPLPNGMMDTLYRIACETLECGASTLWWFPKSSAAAAWNRRAELVREPVELSDDQLKSEYMRGVEGGGTTHEPQGEAHARGLRAVARAARGESK